MISLNEAGPTTFSGPDGVSVFRALVLASGLRLYAQTKILPNKSYTPTNMLRAATGMTGTKYKRGEYIRAADDLKRLADNLRIKIAQEIA
jgi:hypothetical protein